jgi:hypothetical protein
VVSLPRRHQPQPPHQLQQQQQASRLLHQRLL